MAQIDEKQEAIAKICMAIDSDLVACAKIDAEAGHEISTEAVHKSLWAAPNNLNGHSPHWIFGSPRNQSTPAYLRQICVVSLMVLIIVIHRSRILMNG